ncbi:MAG: MarR family winged helix-turn-helix transcriptional regulator [Candidatus Dormibacteria bacterium]
MENGTGFLLGRVHRALRSRWELSLADLGLSAPQAAVLRAAGSRPGTGLRALARVLGTDPMNVRRLALRLERLGLVELRTSNSDARLRMVVVTAQGQQLIAEIGLRAGEQERRMVTLLGPESHSRLRHQLLELDAGLASSD